MERHIHQRIIDLDDGRPAHPIARPTIKEQNISTDSDIVSVTDFTLDLDEGRGFVVKAKHTNVSAE